MKKTHIIIAIGCLSTMFFGACRKYVEVDQYNRRELKYTEDFQVLLNNPDVFTPVYNYPVLSSDDLILAAGNYQNNIPETVYWPYTWATQYVGSQLQDIGWNLLYKQIYATNEIIALVMQSQKGTELRKKEVLAEAKVHRAYAYLLLANQYGAIYDPNTAATALGIPLLTTPELYGKLNRASLADVYAQILKDLNEAITDLPVFTANNRHPDKYAAHAILAITNLYMRNFEQAGLHADEAMKGERRLLNLANYNVGAAGFPKRVTNTETFLSKRNQQNYEEQLNPELLSLFEDQDLRKILFTSTQRPTQNNNLPNGTIISRKHVIAAEFPQAVEVGPSLPEMMLIKAEVLARNGAVNEAMNLVNQLRKSRFKAANLTLLTAVDKNDALVKVVQERRRELFATGKRWFDQRRFNLDPALAKAYTRTFKGETFTLEVNSNKFVYPVASYYLDFNPEIGQSPR